MKRIDWSTLDAAGKKAALARPAQRTAGDVTEVVRTILNDVRERGGAAQVAASVPVLEIVAVVDFFHAARALPRCNNHIADSAPVRYMLSA